MNAFPRTALLGTLSLVFSPSMAQDDAPRIVNEFLGSYCLECHDGSVSKGDRDFEAFELPLQDLADLVAAKDIVDQVTLREMPPKEADQPGDEERLALVRALRGGIAEARSRFESTGSRTVLRRLSNREYENTLATLFGRRVDTLGLTADFPKDATSRHLDNVGSALVTSGFLLDQYFQAANRLVETRLGKPATEPQSWHFTGNFVQYEELSGPHKAAFDYKFLCLYEQPDTDTRQGGYGHIEDFLGGVPVSGLYEIEVQAQALHRDTHYDPKIFGIDFSEPFRLGVVPGDATKGHIHDPQAIEPLLAETVVPDEAPAWLKFEVWLEQGQTPRFVFPNGPYESRASVLEINRRYKDEFKGDISKSGVSRTHLLREGKLPHIRIGEIKIHGPLPEVGGAAEENAVFGPGGFREERAEEQLLAFAEKAFRRPLEEKERERVAGAYRKRLAEGAAPRQAALDTVKLVLCSPGFLYLGETTPEEERLLRPYDLASRLSYALWAGPPDEALLAAAAEGNLADPAALRGQIERMLEDPRSERFVEAFLDGWLNLRELGSQPPPRQAARVYYAEDLPSSMKAEARLFFRHLLEENRPVTDFLDSGYTFVDKKLAKLYDLPEKEELRLADGFRRVELRDRGRRGGVLGMAAVLAVSANGVETSPVTRGVWVSENLLGVVPPAPPDEVPEIESDVSGATTIRERLARHAADRTCAECHRKIDTLGFALESFDPIGRWRSKYPATKKDGPTPPVDASGEFPSGEAYADFREFRRILAEGRRDPFSRHLVSTLLAYATGRHMEVVDDYGIEDILARVREDGYGLRTLVVESLASEIFRSR